MSYGMNISDNIKAFVNTVWEDCVLTARDRAIMPALVRGFADMSGTALRKRSEYGTVTFGTVTDADDLTSQVFTPTVGGTLTPYEFGAQFLITDTRMETDPFGVRGDASEELGQAAAQKIDIDVVGAFKSLSGSIGSTTGGTLTWANFFAAQAKLKQANAPEPYVCVLQPGHWYFLGTAATVAATVSNAPEFQNSVMRNFWVGRVGGIDLYVSNNIASGTTSYGAMFSRDALALDIRRGFRIEPERDASRRGWELNASMLYATGIWRPAFGCYMVGTSVVA